MTNAIRTAISTLLLILAIACLLSMAAAALFPLAHAQDRFEEEQLSQRLNRLEDTKDKSEGRLADLEAAVKQIVKSNEDHARAEERNSNLLYGICGSMLLFFARELFQAIFGRKLPELPKLVLPQ